MGMARESSFEPVIPVGYMPISQMHAEIVQDLGLDDTQQVSNTDIWYRWIFEAGFNNATPAAFIDRIDDFRVQDCVIPKPMGFYALTQAYIMDWDDGELRPIKVRFRPLTDCALYGNFHPNCNRGFNYEYSLVERDFYFELESIANDKLVRLHYRSIWLSPENEPIVHADYRDLYRDYCRLRWIARSRSSGARTYSASDEATAQLQYAAAIRRTRYVATMRAFNEQAMNQIFAQLRDSRYKNTNPYSVQQENNNLLRANGGIVNSIAATGYLGNEYLPTLGGFI